MKYIRNFNKEEKEIYDICHSKNVDYDRIDYLLKNGANANAVEITEYDNQEENEEDLLLMQCLIGGRLVFDESGNQIETDPDFCIKLLKLFIDNGFDVDKYINHFFNEIAFTCDEKNYIDMTKLILNNLKDKQNLNQEKSLTGIGTEESYNNCCVVDHKYANVLSTIYEMIEKYPQGNDPNKYFICDKVVGQKIQNIQIFCKDIKLDLSNKLIADECEIFIQCENDTLNILNKYIFVNNNDIWSNFNRISDDSYFGRRIGKHLKDEVIEKIEFYNEEINSAPHTLYEVTRIEIVISNNKKIVINLDESLCFTKITII